MYIVSGSLFATIGELELLLKVTQPGKHNIFITLSFSEKKKLLSVFSENAEINSKAQIISGVSWVDDITKLDKIHFRIRQRHIL